MEETALIIYKICSGGFLSGGFLAWGVSSGRLLSGVYVWGVSVLIFPVGGGGGMLGHHAGQHLMTPVAFCTRVISKPTHVL